MNTAVNYTVQMNECGSRYVTSEELILLSIIREGGMVGIDGVQEKVNQKKIEFVNSHHAHKIWEGDDGRWRTYLPDTKKPKNRRLVSRDSKDNLFQMLYEFYTENESKRRNELVTMKSLYPEWIDYKLDLNSKATVKRTKTVWKSFYQNDPMIDRPISSLTKTDLERWIAKKVVGMNSHQYGNFTYIVRGLFKYAADNYLIERNPMEHIDSKAIRMKLVPEVKKDSEEEVFSFEERQRIINYAYQQYEKKRDRTQIFVPLAIVCLLNSTMRRGEITALSFDDVHADRNKIVLSDAYSHDLKQFKGRLKDKKGWRPITATEQIIDLINFVKEERSRLGMPTDGYVFCANDNYDSFYSALGKTIRKYCEELNIEVKGIHKTRKTVASVMKASGVDEMTIQDELGHTSYRTTDENYIYNMTSKENKVKSIAEALQYSY